MIDFTKSEILHTLGIFVVAGAVGLLISATVGLSCQTLVSKQAASASFEKDGKIELPADYRQTGKVHSKSGVRAFVGTTPELFAGDAFALHAF